MTLYKFLTIFRQQAPAVPWQVLEFTFLRPLRTMGHLCPLEFVASVQGVPLGSHIGITVERLNIHGAGPAIISAADNSPRCHDPFIRQALLYAVKGKKLPWFDDLLLRYKSIRLG